MSEAIVIAAQAGRALAEAARRAGLRPYVADLFGDADTLALSEAHRPLPGRFGSPIAADATLAAIDELAACAGSPVGIVLGSGFEDAPELVARIAARHKLIGANADAIAALKDPFGFAALCTRLGIPHPMIATDALPDPSAWLLKRTGGSGGSHIRPATHDPAPEGHYLQTRVPGRPYALNLLADGRRIQVLAYTEQWCVPSPIRPYRYGGALVGSAAEIPLLPEPVLQAVTDAVETIIAATGLRGLASADFLADESGWWLTEINPRPGATLDILDRRSTPLLAAHIDASLGAIPALGPQPTDAAAAQICYAEREHAPVPDCPWPDHVRDRPRPGTVVRRDAPLCTVLALGADRQAALDSLKTRTARLQADLAAKKTHPEEAL
jgi:predicted ATP-grasp superfamily ATP-dependent carboligase